jgi:transposase InsO family protein
VAVELWWYGAKQMQIRRRISRTDGVRLLHLESFHGRLRDECLNEHLLSSLSQDRELIAAWRDDYTHHRPHTSLDGLTPREYRNRSEKNQTLNRANF